MRRFRAMGGLRRTMPLTAALFALVALALAGLPPLGGFFSKETIFGVVSERSHPAFIALLVASLITAAYAARAWFAAFAGEARSACARAAHDPTFLLSLPMLCLAIAALLLGALALPPMKEPWARMLTAEPLPAFSWIEAVLSIFVAVVAIAWVARRHRRGELVPMRQVIAARLAYAAYRWFGLISVLDGTGRAALATGRWLDRIEQTPAIALIGAGVLAVGRRLHRIEQHRPAEKLAAAMVRLAQGSARFDQQALDRYVIGGVHKVSLAAARGTWHSDRRWLDGAIAELTQFLHTAAAGLGRVQSGLLHQYYLWFALGAGVLLVYAFMLFGYS
jgi:NADH:ubiquinone oxidoreductase subunit 5 (subunit L)/multisubunit Na+/H+ antiporter MnhA subunit